MTFHCTLMAKHLCDYETIFKQVLVNCRHFTRDANYRLLGGGPGPTVAFPTCSANNIFKPARLVGKIRIPESEGIRVLETYPLKKMLPALIVPPGSALLARVTNENLWAQTSLCRHACCVALVRGALVMPRSNHNLTESPHPLDSQTKTTCHRAPSNATGSGAMTSLKETTFFDTIPRRVSFKGVK